jgi:hypothetical protein
LVGFRPAEAPNPKIQQQNQWYSTEKKRKKNLFENAGEFENIADL